MAHVHAPEALLEHAAFVRAVARAVLRADDMVDDAVQETWLAALQHGKSRRGALRPWLGGIARRKALRLLRSRVRWRKRERASARDEALPAVDEVAARAEIGRRVVHAVLGMAEPYKTTLLLRYYDGVPPKQIAEQLDVSYETVRTRLKRGMRRLRAELAATHRDERTDWRVGLLPLALGPHGASAAAPSLLTTTAIGGGGFVVKKVAAAVLVAVLVLGAWMWKPWEPSSTDDPSGAPPIPSDLLETAAPTETPQLAGRRFGEAARPRRAEALPPPVDLDAADRERDLCGIVRGDGGRPVAGASLRILRYPWRDGSLTVEPALYRVVRRGPRTRSARDGTFRFALEPGDLVYLRVEAEGYTPLELTRLQPGERIQVRLRRGVRLVVRVTSFAAKPAEGVRVLLYPDGAASRLALEGEGVTDADGRAVFEDLPPGERVRVFLFPRADGQAAPTTNTTPPFGLPEEGELVHEVQLIEGWILRGTVTDARTGRRVPDATVSVWWNQLGGVQTDREGRFALPGASDHPMLAVHVVAKGYARTVAPLEGRRTVDVKLHPDQRLTGRIVGADGEPVAGALLRVFGSRPPQWVRDISTAAGTSQEDGTFTLAGLARDIPHTLIIKAPGHGKTLLDFDPPESDRPTHLGDIELPRPCTVAGRILAPDGRPVPHQDLTVVGWNTDRMRFRADVARPVSDHYGTRELRRTDDRGRFRVTDLAPGTYAIRVAPTGQTPIEADVVLAAGATETVDVVMRQVRPLRVRVLDQDDAPVADALVRIQEGTGRVVDDRRTDAKGEAAFTLPRLPYLLSVIPLSTTPYAVPPRRKVGPDAEDAVVRVGSASVLEGRLVDAEGKPILLGYVTAIREARWHAMSQAKGRFVIRLPPGGPVRLRFEGRFRDKNQPGRSFCRPLLAELESVPANARDIVLRAHPVPEDQALGVRLLSPDGKPVAGARVTVTWWRPGKSGASLETGAKGQVAFEDLPALPIRVHPAWTPSRERPWIVPPAEAVVPSGQEIVIQLRRGTVLEGTVTTEADDAGTLGKVYIRAVDPGTNITRAWAQLDEDGRFALVFDAEAQGPFRVIAQRYGPDGRAYEATRDDVRPRGASLELRLRRRAE